MREFEHVGDFADLYALGALDDAEREAADRHIAACAQCAELVAESEGLVTALAAAQAQHAPPAQLERRMRAIVARPPARWRSLAPAIAATLILGLLPSAYFYRQNQAMHAAMVADAAAMNRVALMPHRSVAFTEMSNGSAARVMYAPDGSWYVVLVQGASRALSVAWMHDGQRTMLGTAVPHGDVAMLYLPKSHRMDQLALMDGERIVAEAQLAY
jgi:anti-sigma factor RsiW